MQRALLVQCQRIVLQTCSLAQVCGKSNVWYHIMRCQAKQWQTEHAAAMQPVHKHRARLLMRHAQSCLSDIHPCVMYNECLRSFHGHSPCPLAG